MVHKVNLAYSFRKEGVAHFSVSYSDASQLWASVCSCIRKWADSSISSERVTSPDIACTAVQKDVVGWLHVPKRKHMITFNISGM